MSIPNEPVQRPVVVLLHSSGSSSRQWQGLTELLEGRYRVHAVDLHGHGLQAPWGGDAPLTLADEAALAAPLLAQAGAAHLVGHSYGAAVALKLATLHPQRVLSLVAYEPVLLRWLIDDPDGAPFARDLVAVAEAVRHALAQREEPSAARRFIDFWSGAGTWDALPPDRQRSIAARMPSVARQFDAVYGEPLQVAELARLGIPMSFMTGADTVAATRRLAELLRVALPGARHELLQGMRHMGPVTHAPEVNGRIAGFLRTHAPSGATRAKRPGAGTPA